MDERTWQEKTSQVRLLLLENDAGAMAPEISTRLDAVDALGDEPSQDEERDRLWEDVMAICKTLPQLYQRFLNQPIRSWLDTRIDKPAWKKFSSLVKNWLSENDAGEIKTEISELLERGDEIDSDWYIFTNYIRDKCYHLLMPPFYLVAMDDFPDAEEMVFEDYFDHLTASSESWDHKWKDCPVSLPLICYKCKCFFHAERTTISASAEEIQSYGDSNCKSYTLESKISILEKITKINADAELCTCPLEFVCPHCEEEDFYEIDDNDWIHHYYCNICEGNIIPIVRRN
jgi:hypothetical protein